MKQLKQKIVDYQNFATILIAVSSFFYLGILFTGMDKSPSQINLLLSTIYFFIQLAFTLRLCSLKWLKELEKNEEQ